MDCRFQDSSLDSNVSSEVPSSCPGVPGAKSSRLVTDTNVCPGDVGNSHCDTRTIYRNTQC